MANILKTHKLGEPKYFAGLIEVPMGYAVALAPNIFGAAQVDAEDIDQIKGDFPEYDFQSSEATFGMSEGLGGNA